LSGFEPNATPAQEGNSSNGSMRGLILLFVFDEHEHEKRARIGDHELRALYRYIRLRLVVPCSSAKRNPRKVMK
jgi:hypothetical protein